MRITLDCRRCVFNSPSFKYFTVAWLANPINIPRYCSNSDHLHMSSAVARFDIMYALNLGDVVV